MSDLRALFYADCRALVNELRRVRRNPLRLGLWLLYVGGIALFMLSRTLRAGHAQATGLPDGGTADMLVAFGLLGFAFTIGSGGRAGLFRSEAEARFVIGSPVRSLVAIAYIQLRATIATANAALLRGFSFLFILAPKAMGAGQALLVALLVLSALVAMAALALPRKLAPPRAVPAAIGVAIALGLAAIVAPLRDGAIFLDRAPFTPLALRYLPAWHPGTVLIAHTPAWTLGFVLLAVSAIALLAVMARDAYPELYTISRASWSRSARTREARAGRRTIEARAARRPRASSGAPPIRGVGIFVWKSFLEKRRTAVIPLFVLPALIAAAGFGVGRLTHRDPELLYASFSFVFSILIFVGILMNMRVTSELSMPLFWLARASLLERLCALAIAHSWMSAANALLLAVGLFLGGADPAATLVLACMLPALIIVMAGAGQATNALLPNRTDQGGPVAGLRLLLMLVFLTPPVVALFLALLFVPSLVAGLIGAATALAETTVLVVVAALLLDGRMDRLRGT